MFTFQDINQPVTQGFETEDAAACIPVDGLIGSTGLQDHTSGTTAALLVTFKRRISQIESPSIFENQNLV